MPQQIELNLTPAEAASETVYLSQAAAKLNIHQGQIAHARVIRRSIDARKRGDIRVNMALELYIDSEQAPDPIHLEWGDVSTKTEVLIVGAGPAGLFAALELITLGYRPIILERGKDVSERKTDIAALGRNEKVNPNSNYAFGEGGAGTYSDGKLYTRSKKRGNFRRSLEILHHHGAPESILYDAHPHIGTDRLPKVIAAIRETILRSGGIIRFNSQVTDLIIKGDRIEGVITADGEKITAAATMLATGHSARDIYELLHSHSVLIEAKPFAMGVRVEHQQSLIDTIQYKMAERGEFLPPATYSLVAQAGGRGVYSFCMCPGGFIVPALTRDGECVVNGMSPSGRNNYYANSGIVTQILPQDYADLVPHFGPLAALRFQEQFEKMGYAQGGGAQIAPAQRLDAFVKGQKTRGVLDTSYHPGVVPSDMDKWMPKFMSQSLREGFRLFDNKMRGFITPDAQIIGIESRTSSPVRIPRNADTYMHPVLNALFPVGEGAGYAGGIISAAVDGAAAAVKVAEYIA